MPDSLRNGWVGAVLLFALLYLGVGIGLGELSGRAESQPMRLAWRWVSWLVSAIAFAAHIGYERFRLRSSPMVTALHASGAVALASFGLAVAATIRAASVGTLSPRYALAIVLWPLFTGAPAFLAAFAGAALLLRLQRHS